MNVLMLTGDKRLMRPGSEAHERLELQRGAVEKLEVRYWGRGAVLSPLRVREHFDVVTAQDPFWRGLAAFYIARRIGGRLNIQVHADLAAQSLLRRALAHLTLRRADSVRVVSEKLRRQVERFGVRAPVRVLPLYVDLSRFKDLPREKHPRFEKVVLWLGRFEPEKDPFAALRVFSDVRAKEPNTGLIMAGAGSLESGLHACVHRLGLTGSVEFPGWADPALLLRQADVVLSTSRAESWGASVVEALAAGVPVVSPDIGIAREAGAFVVSRKELAQKVTEVLQSGVRGELKLELPDALQWASRWRETL